MRRSPRLAVLAALLACAPPPDAAPAEPLPACPTYDLHHGRIPLFPNTTILITRSSTRGRTDASVSEARVPTPLARVRAFYERCLATAPRVAADGSASFARPVDRGRPPDAQPWQAGLDPTIPQVLGPETTRMWDTVTLSDHGDGRTDVTLRVTHP